MRTFCMRTEAFFVAPKRRLKMENYIIDDILKILSDDTIYIPKSVAQRSDVYDVSKTLFGVISPIALMISGHTEVILTVKQSVK